MPELVRSLANRLRELIGNRRRAARYRTHIKVTVALSDMKPTAIHTSAAGGALPTLKGHTRDISATGLALVTPAIRIGGRYLTGEGQDLLVTLDISPQPIRIHATPVRYEQLGREDEETGYLIGLHITSMDDGERSRYMQYLSTLTDKTGWVRQRRGEPIG